MGRRVVALGLSLTVVCTACGTPPEPEAVVADVQPVAFINVNVVPMDGEHVLEGQTVLIRGGYIEAVGPVGELLVPQDALRIDGEGKYLLPGLADMHVHLWNEDHMILFLANGVTTVRNMWGAPLHLRWREQIDSGELLGPAIYTAGPLMDGSPPSWDGSTVIETREEAHRAVAEQKDAGYDFIKVYGRLSAEAYDALVTAAAEHGMPVAGHVPIAVGLNGVLAAKQASIEHLGGYVAATLAEDSPLLRSGSSSGGPSGIAARVAKRILDGEISFSDVYDEAKIAAVVAATREAGVWNVPTLVVFQYISVEEAADLLGRPEMRYVDPGTIASWVPSEDVSSETTRYLRVWNEAKRQRVKTLHDAGARLLLGSDTPNPFVAPGFSIHQELQNLVDSGLTPYESIKAGTHDAAEFLDALDLFGTISPGKRADLILVNGNPLDDVANVARRSGVMVRGRWLTEDELRSRLEELADSYGAPNAQFASMSILSFAIEQQMGVISSRPIQ